MRAGYLFLRSIYPFVALVTGIPSQPTTRIWPRSAVLSRIYHLMLNLHVLLPRPCRLLIREGIDGFQGLDDAVGTVAVQKFQQFPLD
jgi:hypothetical protein